MLEISLILAHNMTGIMERIGLNFLKLSDFMRCFIFSRVRCSKATNTLTSCERNSHGVSIAFQWSVVTTEDNDD